MPGHHPYDERGRAVPRDCPVCITGKLQYEYFKCWECDGLMDPDDPHKELQCCTFNHFDGEPYRPRTL